MEFVEPLLQYHPTDQDLKLLLIVFGVFWVVFFFLGAFDKVTIFTDYKDLSWGGAIVISPFCMLLCLSWFAPEPVPKNYDFLFETTQTTIVSVIFLLVIAAGLIVTLLNAIAANGIIVGVLVWIFKVVSSCLIVLVLFRMFEALTNENRKVGTIFLVFGLFGLLMFVIRLLVNGERVENRKMLS